MIHSCCKRWAAEPREEDSTTKAEGIQIARAYIRIYICCDTRTTCDSFRPSIIARLSPASKRHLHHCLAGCFKTQCKRQAPRTSSDTAPPCDVLTALLGRHDAKAQRGRLGRSGSASTSKTFPYTAVLYCMERNIQRCGGGRWRHSCVKASGTNHSSTYERHGCTAV